MSASELETQREPLTRHSGAERSEEPGIHNHDRFRIEPSEFQSLYLRLWIPGSTLSVAPEMTKSQRSAALFFCSARASPVPFFLPSMRGMERREAPGAIDGRPFGGPLSGARLHAADGGVRPLVKAGCASRRSTGERGHPRFAPGRWPDLRPRFPARPLARPPHESGAGERAVMRESMRQDLRAGITFFWPQFGARRHPSRHSLRSPSG
jgi:hypothetical protein